MDVLRAFVGCELPPALQDAIQAATAGLHRALGADLIRWVPPRNIHVTLKFLGDVAPPSMEGMEAAVVAAAAKCPAFDVRVGGLGCYPNPRRPRVLWTGVDAPAELAVLQHNVDIESARLGFASEERLFSPHLTIGRVRQHTSEADLQRIVGALEQTKLGDIGGARVEAVHLFSSELRAMGAVYTKLFSAPLGLE